MHNLICNFPVIGKVSIDIQNTELFVFAKRQFVNYVLKESTVFKDKIFISIKAETFNNLEFDNVILGRDIKFKNNELKIKQNSRVQKFDIEYCFNDKLMINIDFNKKPLYYLKSLLSSEYSMSHSLFYQTILYPIFSLYAIKENYSLVHGSLLKLDNKYIVLAGLDGVGKSSLSNELVLRSAKIVADNFVLFNGDKFIGLNMPIRLDLENSIKDNVIYKDDNLQEVLYDYVETKEVEVEKVYFLSIGEKLAIKQMNKNIVKQNWNLINNGASEILGANLFNLPFLYQNSLSESISESKFNSYTFSIPKGKIQEATKELICQLNI